MQTASLAATKWWTGGGGDGQWINPNNWDNNLLPAIDDDVLLDNNFIITNYTVVLPTTMVAIRTVTIRPAMNQTIQLILPATNLVEPGFTATGPGYGVNLERGAIFMNASGLTSGEALVIADSIRINNGGRYIHHTRASHANNIVRLLSTVPGTELGIFEFDVPRASYTISASNRKYGSLVFRAVASGGATTYACNGSNPLTINGNLQIEEGVNFSVDLGGPNGNLLIRRDYIQNGGIFNLASGMGNTTIVRIQGNLIQSASGQITETNTGLPAIELNGSVTQIISLAGSIQNSITMKMNNQEGAILLAPLQLPYQLDLIQGRITTTASNLLTLLPDCSVVVDSTAANTSYVDGPIVKLGLAATPYFLFPVGKSGNLRWLELKNASGNFIVEYVKANPIQFSNTYGPGIDHISSKEYWTVTTSGGLPALGTIELSFLDPGSGGVTDLPSLRVAELVTAVWKDDGQASATGNFGSAGSVVSNLVSQFQTQGYFTLASNVNMENPLPIRLRHFSVQKEGQQAHLQWTVELPEDVDRFDILQATDQRDLTVIFSLNGFPGREAYDAYAPLADEGPNYFRIRIIEKNGGSFMSKVVAIQPQNEEILASIYPTIVQSNAALRFHTDARINYQWLVVGMDGRKYQSGTATIEKGESTQSFDIATLPSGFYQFLGFAKGKRIFLLRFIKRK